MAQDEQQRVQRIKEYVLARLRGELSAAPRGAQARLAKRLGVSGAHLSNMLSPTPTRQPGEDFRRKVAAHWGITYAQLEALATGEEMPVRSGNGDGGAPTSFFAAVSTHVWSSEIPMEMRRLVTEQARQYHAVLGIDMAIAEWHGVFTSLERAVLVYVARRNREGRGNSHPPGPPEGEHDGRRRARA